MKRQQVRASIPRDSSHRIGSISPLVTGSCSRILSQFDLRTTGQSGEQETTRSRLPGKQRPCRWRATLTACQPTVSAPKSAGVRWGARFTSPVTSRKKSEAQAEPPHTIRSLIDSSMCDSAAQREYFMATLTCGSLLPVRCGRWASHRENRPANPARSKTHFARNTDRATATI